jgi:hypothetical protein
MAKYHIDAAITESKEDFTITGSATVTGAVRLAWDDTITKGDLINLIDRIKMRVIEDLSD